MTLNVKPKPLRYNRIPKKIKSQHWAGTCYQRANLYIFLVKAQKAFICQPFLLLREELPVPIGQNIGFWWKTEQEYHLYHSRFGACKAGGRRIFLWFTKYTFQKIYLYCKTCLFHKNKKLVRENGTAEAKLGTNWYAKKCHNRILILSIFNFYFSYKYGTIKRVKKISQIHAYFAISCLMKGIHFFIFLS